VRIVVMSAQTLLGDLPAGVVASFAEKAFIVEGRSRWTAALLHRALELEGWNPTALATLSGFLDDGGLGKFPVGFKVLSAVILEWALTPASPLDRETRRSFDEVRFLSIWAWGFSRRRDGKKQLSSGEFADREAFVVDDEAYCRWWQAAVEQAGSMEAAAAAAVGVVGHLAGFLRKRSAEVHPTVCGVYARENMVMDEERYGEWRAFPADRLDRISEAFAALKKSGD
jgi:hypothetical protein